MLELAESPARAQEAAPHPENVMERPARAPRGLGSMVTAAVLGALFGTIVGVLALSTAVASEEPWSILSVVPLVMAAVAIVGAYVGAVAWLAGEPEC